MTCGSEWQGKVGQSWAEEWRRTDQSFSLLTDRLLRELRGQQFVEALDIGCGAGEISLAVARNYPEAQITGIDISSELIAAARSRSEHLTNADFLLADASDWRPPSDRRPQMIISRHGVMFFDDPVQAFNNIRSGAAPGAKLAFSCFQNARENEWILNLSNVAPINLDASEDYAPGPFAFGNRDRVHMILAEAGWADITVEPVEYAMIFGSGADAVSEAVRFFARIGPAARVLAETEGRVAKEKFLLGMQSVAREHCVDDLVAMPAAAWIVTAKA